MSTKCEGTKRNYYHHKIYHVKTSKYQKQMEYSQRSRKQEYNKWDITEISHEGRQIQNNEEIANSFHEYFLSIGKKSHEQN